MLGVPSCAVVLVYARRAGLGRVAKAMGQKRKWGSPPEFPRARAGEGGPSSAESGEPVFDAV
jgi:hypothetical protein